MFGKTLVMIGAILAAIGGIIWLLGKAGVHFGQLPGDISLRSEKMSAHFPIVTSIVVSILLTILVNIFLWLFRK
jgi:hypothetical protein